MIKIEKNIPIPKRYNTSNFPFENMEIGDSFFVACDKKAIRVIRAIVYKLQKRIDRKYQSQAKKDGIRIWRIK